MKRLASATLAIGGARVALVSLLIAASLAADPVHGSAAATAAAGWVGFGPGIAIRGSATAAWWGWAHIEAMGAVRRPEYADVAGVDPFALFGAELGITPPIPRGVAGVAVAIDLALDRPGSCFDGRGCLSPYAGLAPGAVWALDHEGGGEFEAFVGVGLYTHFDIVTLSWRARLAWTLPDKLQVGVVAIGKWDLLLEVGRAW